MARKEASIGRKLTTIILITSTAALLFTCAAFFVYEYFTFRQDALRNVETLGKIIAANSTAALAFNSPADARETLSALKTEPQIVAASLYGPDGVLFARFPESRPAEAFPDAPGAVGFRFAHGFLEGFEPVSQGGNRRLGTLYLRSDTSALYARFRLYSLIVALVLVASVLMVLVISRRLQRQISRPLLALAETARAVSDRQNYSVRAPSVEGQEMRLLTDAFNHMLTQSEAHEHAQGEGRRKLEAQLERMELLRRITHAISERQSLHDLFKVVIDSLEANLPIDFGCVCLYEPPAETVTVAATGSRGVALAMQMAMAERAQIAIGQNGLARCLRGNLVYEPDLGELSAPFTDRLRFAGLASLVIAPLRAESNVFGLLLAARREPKAFSSGDCEFLRQLTEHVALASHQTQLHNALQRAYDDLRLSQQTVLQQERLTALGQMASGIAHDINNALSPVSLYTESLLEREPNLSERARDQLRTIQRGIDDVVQTVARMREFYRPREPQLVLTQVDLNDLARQVVNLTRARWRDVPQERGVVIELSTELSEDLPKIMGAESEIRDALTNLIFNAVDAMPHGGVLGLHTRVVSASSPGDEPLRHAVIELRDTGVGMDEETRRRCLEPFYTTKGERGTGLGLAMVFGMAKRHSADLEIESRVGSGTIVRLIFPVPDTMAAVARMPTSQLDVPRQRILIVDDDPLLIRSLREILEADGHVVAAAEGGQAAIETFTAAEQRGEPFGVLITDLGMPYVDGRRVAATVRGRSASTVIILLTGWGQRLLDENDVPPGVNRVLSKPPKLHELRAALVELTGRKPTAG
jgi:signal transduction histidine kinase/ActR/RegA family two-component response regulator